MPEGHTLYRIAARHRELLGGRPVQVDSPQGRFSAGAARLDGRDLTGVQSYGKHLFYEFAGAGLLHVHLGLYGAFRDGTQPAPEPRGAVRLRMQNEAHWVELRGATAVELLDPAGREAILARLGPDPLARRPNPAPFLDRVGRSRAPVAALLMDQSVLAGVGNVFRAEVLFRAGLDPFTPGRAVGPERLRALWDDLVRLMRAGVRTGRIVSTRPADRRPAGRATPQTAHYVYRRAGLPCRVCGAPVRAAELAGRRLYWCAGCQGGRVETGGAGVAVP